VNVDNFRHNDVYGEREYLHSTLVTSGKTKRGDAPIADRRSALAFAFTLDPKGR